MSELTPIKDVSKLYYRLGRGSLKEARDVLKNLIEQGDIAIYLESDADLEAAYRELLILSNIDFLEGRSEKPGSINLDLWRAYIKSKRKLVVSDEEVSSV